MDAATSTMIRPAWYAAELLADHTENPHTRTLVLGVPGWPGHLPGQHVDLRLTAEDGYTATRSYSLAAPADGDRIRLTVQRVPGGEVSPYLVDDLLVGASVEVLGPIGGWFVWRPVPPAPTLLVAGGTGIVPLMAMARAWHAQRGAPLRLLYSLRSPDLLCYADELAVLGADAGLLLAYTRQAPPGTSRPAGRLTAAELAGHGLPPGGTDCFVCGPTGFVEALSRALTGLGHDPARIRTERFGSTGG